VTTISTRQAGLASFDSTVARGGVWEDALGDGRAVRMACNQRMCDAQTPVVDGAEVAFFPPVTGG
jgi:molybdopterin synthase sulfur carrier subunit